MSKRFGLNLRISKEQRDAIYAHCASSGVEFSSWCRATLLARAGRKDLIEIVPRGRPPLRDVTKPLGK